MFPTVCSTYYLYPGYLGKIAKHTDSWDPVRSSEMESWQSRPWGHAFLLSHMDGSHVD